jgi:hypothetical protein
VRTPRRRQKTVSPEEVYRAAKRKERENLKFRSSLKNHADDEELDRQFLALHKELFEGYDCSQCANCCRAYSTVLGEDEISAISDHLGMTSESIQKKYLVQGVASWELKGPCAFLKDNGRCGIENHVSPGNAVNIHIRTSPEGFLVYTVF